MMARVRIKPERYSGRYGVVTLYCIQKWEFLTGWVQLDRRFRPVCHDRRYKANEWIRLYNAVCKGRKKKK